jgi:hypothetical protein
LNRKARRALKQQQREQVREITTAVNRGGLIPVFGPGSHLPDAMIWPHELARYEAAPNAVVIRERATGATRVLLRNFSDDTNMVVHRGNPRRYSHDHETPSNPQNVWALRRLVWCEPDDDREAAEQFVRDVFRASVLDNLKDNRRDNVRAFAKPKMPPRPATKAA